MSKLKRLLLYSLLIGIVLVVLLGGLALYGYFEYISADISRMRTFEVGHALPIFHGLELGANERDTVDRVKSYGIYPLPESRQWIRFVDRVFLETKRYYLDYEDGSVEAHVTDDKLSQVVYELSSFPFSQVTPSNCDPQFQALLNDFNMRFGQPIDDFSTKKTTAIAWAIPGGYASLSKLDKSLCMIRARKNAIDYGAYTSCRENCHSKESK
jgi:hypothetical protein